VIEDSPTQAKRLGHILESRGFTVETALSGETALARLVRTTAEDRRPVLEQAGLALAVQTPETPAWVQGDTTRLAQVLANRLDNATKFTDPGGRVAVRLVVGPDSLLPLLTGDEAGAS
jgi:signal transduction histidine kinase